MFKKLLIVSAICGFGLSGLGAKDISTAIKSIEVNDELLNFIVDRCNAGKEIDEKNISNLKISSELNEFSLSLINEAILNESAYINKNNEYVWVGKNYCNKKDLKQILQEYKFVESL